jgi:hypothetical protein
MLAVQIGGGLMILAGIICYLIVNEKRNAASDEQIALLEIEGERSV